MAYSYDFFSFSDTGLPPDVWRPFADVRPAQPYKKDAVIYLEQEPADFFYYLVSGAVKTFISSDEGGEKALTVYRPGQIFGEASFFEELPRMSSAVAAEDSKIIAIDRPLVMELFKKDPELAFPMLKYLAHTIRMLSLQVNNIIFQQADRRVAAHLLSLCPSSDQVICTHEDISQSVGVSRVTVSRILREFNESGWIQTKYRKIQITNRGALSEFARPVGSFTTTGP